ncbi:hypothetical protein MMC25_005504 [Agyrium rufum]|nr:hypothetical protein [Agyrium rufum]
MAASPYIESTPEAVKNSKGLHLLTYGTSNAQRVHIVLEELHDAYGLEWDTTVIDIKGSPPQQKSDWMYRLNPSGRVPVLVDNTQSPPFPIMETSAEMLYLENKYDTNNLFSFDDPLERNEALQWMFFSHGSAPIFSQLVFFHRFAPEKPPIALRKYKNENLQAFGILEDQLSGKYTGVQKEYLAGKGAGKYSFADMTIWGLVKSFAFAGLTKDDMAPFPNLMQWVERIGQRPAVQRATSLKYMPPGFAPPTGPQPGKPHP